MQELGSVQQVGRRLRAQVLIWGGLLLLLGGGFLAYPYVGSRLAAPPSTPTATQPPLRSTSTTASPTQALTPTLTHTPIPILTRRPTSTLPPAIPDRVVIPAIDLDAPIVPVSQTMTKVDGQEQPTFEIPDTRAAGWHETSAPLGAPGNTVLNGHNTTHGEVFRDLYKLKEGDEIVVYSWAISYTYTVSETLILAEAGRPLEVRVENASYIQPTGDERLTLVTCHPYGSLRNRLIVIARPVSE
jgi:sortase A